MNIQVSQHLLLRLSISNCIFSAPLLKIGCPYMCGIISVLVKWLYVSNLKKNVTSRTYIRDGPSFYGLSPFFLSLSPLSLLSFLFILPHFLFHFYQSQEEVPKDFFTKFNMSKGKSKILVNQDASFQNFAAKIYLISNFDPPQRKKQSSEGDWCFYFKTKTIRRWNMTLGEH